MRYNAVMIRIAILALALIISACRFQLEDEGDEPPRARTAPTQDPRCFPGGTWSDSAEACEYPDTKPPALRIAQPIHNGLQNGDSCAIWLTRDRATVYTSDRVSRAAR